MERGETAKLQTPPLQLLHDCRQAGESVGRVGRKAAQLALPCGRITHATLEVNKADLCAQVQKLKNDGFNKCGLAAAGATGNEKMTVVIEICNDRSIQRDAKPEDCPLCILVVQWWQGHLIRQFGRTGERVDNQLLRIITCCHVSKTAVKSGFDGALAILKICRVNAIQSESNTSSPAATTMGGSPAALVIQARCKAREICPAWRGRPTRDRCLPDIRRRRRTMRPRTAWTT